jgi:HK97 family phage major capsid protein
MAKAIEDQLTEVQGELKTHFAKAAEEMKNMGVVLQSTKDDTGALTVKINAVQKQADAIEQKIADKHAAGGGDLPVPLEQQLKENEGVQKLMRDRRGIATFVVEAKNMPRAFQRKTTITSAGVGWQTTGVLQIERIPGITIEPRTVLKVRDLFPARPTALQVIDYVRVTTPPAIASPAPETVAKVENAVAFTSFSERVKTIATWIPATKQILDDFAELAGYINTALPFYVDLAEELGLLSGDGTAENLHGILPQATAFNTGLLVPASGYTRIDVIGRAIEQLNIANELDPTFVVMNPKDWWSLRLTKDSFGRYLLGDPETVGDPNIFGLSVVWTPSMPTGQFLVGSGSPVASEIRDRMSMQVEISTEHMDFFVKNLVAVRAEKRLAYIVKRPGSFISGTLGSSPIS